MVVALAGTVYDDPLVNSTAIGVNDTTAVGVLVGVGVGETPSFIDNIL